MATLVDMAVLPRYCGGECLCARGCVPEPPSSDEASERVEVPRAGTRTVSIPVTADQVRPRLC